MKRLKIFAYCRSCNKLITEYTLDREQTKLVMERKMTIPTPVHPKHKFHKVEWSYKFLESWGDFGK